MNRRVLLVVAVTLIVAAVAPAAAQNIESNFVIVSFGFGNPRTAKTWDLPVRWEGSVVVRFESSFGSGETVWTPGPQGQFTAGESQTRLGRRMAAFLASTGASSASARVVSVSGTCTDSASIPFDQAAVIQGRDSVRIGLAGSSPGAAGFHMTETRCGGPLLDDIGRALRMVTIRRGQLLAGSFDVDFRGSGPISAPGMRGSVVSTVVAHVGARAPEPAQRPDEVTPGGTRQLSVDYGLTRVTGAVQATLAGGGELCADLDSCGRRAVLDLRPAAARHAALQLSAYASGRRPPADLRAALGLPNRGGRRAGISWIGDARWSSRATTLAARVSDAGGEVCADQRHLPTLVLQLRPSGPDAIAELAPDFAATARTSCPGPALASAGPRAVLASARIPRAAIGRKRITLHLRRGHALTTDGWSGRTRADVTIVLERRAIHSRVVRF